MKQPRPIIEAIESRLLLSVARPAYNTGSGFFQLNGKIYDANGNEFVMKGMNQVHAWGSYNTNYNTIDQLAKTGANAVRTVMYQDIAADNGNPWTDAADTPARRQTVVERYIANGIVPIVEDHASIADGGSVQSNKNALDQITAHWITNQPWLKTYEKYVILNIANEWGSPAGNSGANTTWRDAYIDEVGKLRRGADNTLGTSDDITNLLMIDAGAWGQDYNTLRLQAASILAADPQQNIVFSIHFYGSWRDDSRTFEITPNNDYGPWDIQTSMTTLTNAHVPVVVGEWASEDFKDFGSSSAPYGAYRTRRVMQILDSLGIGWMGWSWNGSSPQSLNMVTNLNNTNYNSNTDLSEWGNTLINEPTYGLKASAKRASVFSDPLPGMPNPASPLPALPGALPPETRFVLENTTIGAGEGGQAAVRVRLNQAPPSDVLLSLTKLSGDADLSLFTLSLTFTAANWNVYQSIIVNAAGDADATVGTAKFQLAAPGLLLTDFSVKEIEAPALPTGNVLTLNPDRDRLYSGSGTLAALTVDSVFLTPNSNPTPNGTMYLRFPLGSLRGKLTSATLRIYTTNTTANRRVRVFGAIGDTWTETSSPSNTTPIYASYPLFPGADNTGFALPTAAGYVDISFSELTSFVAAEYLKDAVVTLALRMVSGTASFQTREGANPPQLILNTAEAVPPTLTASVFMFDQNPNRIRISFDDDVSASIGAADVLVTPLAGGSPLVLAAPTYDSGTNTATFAFNPGVVPDGRYRATLIASGISDAAGNTMLRNASFDFFALAGDANHDATIDFDDLLAVAQHYEQPGTFADGDFDYSGTINFDDLLIIAQKYGTSLATQAPSALPASRRRSGAARDVLA